MVFDFVLVSAPNYTAFVDFPEKIYLFSDSYE